MTAINSGPARVFPRKRAVATALFTDAQGQVRVVKPTYKQGWELPGGAVEDNESPRQAAAREVLEELHLVRVPGRILALDYVSAVASSAGTDGLVVVFDGGTLTEDPAGLQLASEELSEAMFADAVAMEQRLPALLSRRDQRWSAGATTSGEAGSDERGLVRGFAKTTDSTRSC